MVEHVQRIPYLGMTTNTPDALEVKQPSSQPKLYTQNLCSPDHAHSTQTHTPHTHTPHTCRVEELSLPTRASSFRARR